MLAIDIVFIMLTIFCIIMTFKHNYYIYAAMFSYLLGLEIGILIISFLFF